MTNIAEKQPFDEAVALQRAKLHSEVQKFDGAAKQFGHFCVRRAVHGQSRTGLPKRVQSNKEFSANSCHDHT
jgi:hypothetical protein